MADPPTQRRPRTPLPPPPDGAPPGQRPPGGQPSRQMPRMPGSRTFWIVVLVALTLNYVVVALFAPGKERSVTIPYSPAFLKQVNENNVKRVSTQGATVTGEFKREVHYPKPDSAAARNFETEIPTWIIESGGTDLTNRLTQP